MKRFLTGLMSAILITTIGVTAFASVDRAALEEVMRARMSQRINEMLRLMNAEEIKESELPSDEFYCNYEMIEADLDAYMQQRIDEMMKLIEAEKQKAIEASSESAATDVDTHDASLEPIVPDICVHDYEIKRIVTEEFRNMPIGRDFIKVTYYEVCVKCGYENPNPRVETFPL